jgi:peroxiredoxin
MTAGSDPADFRSLPLDPAGAHGARERREFARREAIPYPLLNDSGFRLAEELGLPTFEANGVRYYSRLTFIAREGRVAKVFYPVVPPQDNASDVMAWLRTQGT